MATKTTKKQKRRKFSMERTDRLEKVAQAAALDVDRTHENAIVVTQGELQLELAVQGKKVEATFGPLSEAQAAKVLTSTKLVEAFLRSFA